MSRGLARIFLKGAGGGGSNRSRLVAVGENLEIFLFRKLINFSSIFRFFPLSSPDQLEISTPDKI